MDDFVPLPYLTLDDQLEKLEKSEEKRQSLEQECYRLRQTGEKSKLKKLQAELDTLAKRQEALIQTVERRTALLAQNRRVRPTRDEVPQTYNECVGYAYGVAIYVDDSGQLLYRESQEDAVELGETAGIDTLHSFNDLPPGERDMILRDITKQEECPDWFRERYGKEA